ncbi:MAG: conserved hypothetical protein [Leptospirillum rubarum]|uniref:SAM-dependent methyltransferase n=1 Tax=Leptospirillum sp. Group II '5-way CG' TaxID=419541 RepID=B6AS81_9BACT|nr:MAG: conserved hypothetical protein [Leptospirillum rubarum]EDZ38301.1 MAG: Conserved hypothetical protein [Leptospirillum sp. Group II '5-way CG']
MSFSLDEVVPWGRSFEEYVSMFALSREDLAQNILGCADGPASFNTHLTKRGGRIVSVDPLYQLSRDEIERRIRETYGTVLEQTRKNAHEFVWKSIGSVEEMGRVRMEAMDEFLSDYPEGLQSGRYMAETLPSLSFSDGQFDLALCSHFLFLYSEHLSLNFHIQSLVELCRVAEVRIFPILELGAVLSRHLDSAMNALEESGHSVSLVRVDYEFQKGGNQMLVIRRNGPSKN